MKSATLRIREHMTSVRSRRHLNALFVAGGPTQKGSLRIVKHYRGNQLVQVVDLYDLLLHGVKSELQRLENGDSVLVPPIGPQVTVEGMVRRPAIYELKDEKNLAHGSGTGRRIASDGDAATHRSAAAGGASEADDDEPGHSGSDNDSEVTKKAGSV